AVCYPHGFRADGGEEVCFPEQESVPPLLTDRPRYPSVARGKCYGLTDAVGLQAFFLVVSRQRLPAFAQWRRTRGVSPWQETRVLPPPPLAAQPPGPPPAAALGVLGPPRLQA